MVSIAFDRFIRACLPHHTRQWCTQKNVIVVFFIIIICSIAFNSHVLSPNFSVAFPFTRVICGPSHINATDYANFYYLTWPILQMCINILLPALLMIISLFMIYKKSTKCSSSSPKSDASPYTIKDKNVEILAIIHKLCGTPKMISMTNYLNLMVSDIVSN